MSRRAQSGLTFPEIVVAILVLVTLVGILYWLTLPSISVGFVKSPQTQVLSNMKQLHLATQQMAMDGATATNTAIGWPGDIGGSFATWASNLVSGGYLSTNDLCKLLSAPGRITPRGQLPLTNHNAVLVYAAKETSDGFAVFLTTANFTNTPTGGLPPNANSKPYGQKGFVLFHKAGDGLILANRQSGPAYTNIIGTFVPLCQ